MSTKLYKNIGTYEEAGYNKPYVTAIFNKSIISGDFFNFTLGKHFFIDLFKLLIVADF